MKNLIISTFCLLLLIIPWGIYGHYASNTIDNYTETLSNTVIPAIITSDWECAEKAYEEITGTWNKFENISEYFLDTEAVNEADKLINRTLYHIKMHDSSNASADSSELKHLLNYLYQNEKLSSGNIL